MLTMNASTFSRLAERYAEPSEMLMSHVIEHIRAEYVEMPGLSVTLPQAARLWGLSTSQSERLLSTLVDSGFLLCDRKGVYRRRR
jgi:Fic family protein